MITPIGYCVWISPTKLAACAKRTPQSFPVYSDPGNTEELLECLKDARRLLTDQDAIDLAHIDEVISKAEGAVA